MTENTVDGVAKRGLCIGCGVCVSICPVGAIKMLKDNKKGIYQSHVSDKCLQCGLCSKTCFGVQNNSKSSFIFNEGFQDAALGSYLNCYSGHSFDKNIRFSSSSGGIVTDFLLFALEEKMVDGVLVTKMSEEKPFEAHTFIAETRAEVLSAAQSKYCPVNISAALKSIMNSKGYFAVVGLPCHIYGIRKAAELNPELKQKIVLYIGLFCGGTPSFLATEYLIRRLDVKKEDVIKIDFRSGGWPSKMSVHIKDSNNGTTTELSFPYTGLWNSFASFFLQYRCTLCNDGFSECADISCGDAWLPEFKSKTLGTSLVITRSKIGEKLVNAVNNKGKISLRNIEPIKIKQAQSNLINFKGQNLVTRIRLLKTLRQPLPSYNEINSKTQRVSLGICIYSIMLYGMQFMASKRCMWRLLDTYCILRRHM